MTIIACRIQEKGGIELASDSQTTWGTNKYPLQDRSDNSIKANGKLFQVNGINFGCAGSVAHIGLLQIYSKTNKPKEMECDDILDWFLLFREWANKEAKINFPDIALHGIMVKDGRAFVFYDHLEVFEIKTFAAIGSGMFLAIGAMELGATAAKAASIAVKYDLYCGGEIIEKYL